MYILLLILMTVLLTPPQWVLVAHGEFLSSTVKRRADFYIDKNSIKRDGDVVKVRLRMELPDGPGQVMETTRARGLSVYVIENPMVVDCATNVILTNECEYALFDAQGRALKMQECQEERIPRPLTDELIAYQLWEFLCERPTTTEPVSRPTLKHKAVEEVKGKRRGL